MLIFMTYLSVTKFKGCEIPAFLLVVIIISGFCAKGISQQLLFEKKFTGINILPPSFVYERALPRQISEFDDETILIMGNCYSIDTSGVNASEIYHDLKNWTRKAISSRRNMSGLIRF